MKYFMLGLAISQLIFYMLPHSIAANMFKVSIETALIYDNLTGITGFMCLGFFGVINAIEALNKNRGNK